MKRLLILLAIGLMSISCKSVEDKTIDYCEEIYEAAIDNDIDEFRECCEDFYEWYKDLSYRDQEEVDWVVEKWDEKNFDKCWTLLEFAGKHDSFIFGISSILEYKKYENVDITQWF